MESLLGSLSLGFLLRSLFAGVFFLLSYYSAKVGLLNGPADLHKDSSTFALALFAGLGIYGLHRSLFYPLIEYVFDMPKVRNFRAKYPLISASTLSDLTTRWDRGADNQKTGIARAGKICGWADLAHMQYASSLCIGAGTVVAKCDCSQELEISWPLVILAVLLGTAALVSDWRLHVVERYITENESVK